jgi:hypothetical protein
LLLLEQDDHAHQQQLKAQIAASESKIRMLRVSIADLSEENDRNLVEVERRGLSGGVTLVRGLREEIRDIDFQLSEAKSGDAECRTKISLIQELLRAKGKGKPDSAQSTGLSSYDEPAQTQTASGLSSQESRDVCAEYVEKDSDRIATGQSTALTVRTEGGRGFFPLSLWQIFLRILGRGAAMEIVSRSSWSSTTGGASSHRQPAVII